MFACFREWTTRQTGPFVETVSFPMMATVYVGFFRRSSRNDKLNLNIKYRILNLRNRFLMSLVCETVQFNASLLKFKNNNE